MLQSPIPGEDLLLYLGVGEDSVSAVLVREEGKKQWSIYYVSRTMKGAELRYPVMEKLALAMVSSARRLRPYFQAHSISVVTDYPLKNVLIKPERSGRLLKWAFELSKFDIKYVLRAAIKGQALADFLADIQDGSSYVNPFESMSELWVLYVDGSCSEHSGGIGVFLKSPARISVTHSAVLDFKVTNNQAEYEALIAGLRFASGLGALQVQVFSDSQLIVNQVLGTYDVHDNILTKYLEKAKAEIGKFNHFTIKQISREQNKLADQLSRGEGLVSCPNLRITEPTINEFEIHHVDDDGTKGWMDPFLIFLSTGVIPPDIKDIRRFRIKSAFYMILDGSLFRKSLFVLHLKCVAESQQSEVLQSVHSGECGSHSGGRTLSHRILRQGYFWPTLRKDAENFSKYCDKCQKFAPMQLQPAYSLRSITSPWPFAVWGMDLLGPFPPARG